MISALFSATLPLTEAKLTSVRKYNAAFAAYRGKALGSGKLPYNCIIKHSLPNYREFDDSRYFYSLAQLAAELETTPQQLAHPVEVEIKGQKLKLGIMLCEDGWTENYHFSTPSALAENGSDIFTCRKRFGYFVQPLLLSVYLK